MRLGSCSKSLTPAGLLLVAGTKWVQPLNQQCFVRFGSLVCDVELASTLKPFEFTVALEFAISVRVVVIAVNAQFCASCTHDDAVEVPLDRFCTKPNSQREVIDACTGG